MHPADLKTTLRAVPFDRERLNIEDIVDIANGSAGAVLSADPEFRAAIARGADFLDRLLREDGTIYGVTTGYGDSCTVTVPPELVAELPHHLYTYHGCGLGECFTPAQTRAIIAARLASLCKGYSGVSIELLEQIVRLLDHGLLPLIPSEGSVGASGDLTPLSYLAAALCGEREVWRDGTQIPVSIVYPAGLPRDGSAPLHLYGYGAYGMAMEPGFSTGRLSLLDRGFAFAIAHIRGGDDLGQQWYLDGKLDKRNNTFTDFVDVARGLIDLGYSSKGRISISGGSAGGELMGAVINSDPDLWGAVVAHVPFVDVLNTMLDETLPLTPGEWPEWGNPIEDKAAFETILAYDPYANVKAQDYPPLMVTAGLNDPRVTYWEPAKWVAKLRATKTDDNVLLLKTNMGAGHGGKSGRFESLHESAEEFAFILWQMGMAGA